jgi:uncharacterized protein (DUF1015 family)
MPRIFPFEALVYDVAVAGALERVTTPPYDVISEARRQDYQATPFNIVQIDLGAGDGDDRYARAGAQLQQWVADGVLVRTARAFHAYEMRSSAAEPIRGVFCAMELEDWGGAVMPHEQTMAGPVEDRLRLLRATHTHLSAVYGTVGGPCPSLEDLLDHVTAGPPDAELTDEQDVVHRRWTVSADVPIGDWLAEEPLLIADGHHRYTTALAYRDEKRATHGPGPWDRLLTFVVDAGSERLSVRPFHRIQLTGDAPEPGTPGGDLEAVLRTLSDDDPRVGIVRRTGETGTELTLRDLAGEPPAVRALHDGLLDALASSDGLRYTPDPQEALTAVASGEAIAAYLLPPTTPDRIRNVVDRGERLPQKSTYFWPKPRTGVILMPLDSVVGSSP